MPFEYNKESVAEQERQMRVVLFVAKHQGYDNRQDHVLFGSQDPEQYARVVSDEVNT